jgi:hypothetical protein
MINRFLKKQCLVLTLLVAALMAPATFARDQPALGASVQASEQDNSHASR